MIGDSFGEIRPYASGFRAEVEIDFANPVIGQQSYALRPQPGTLPPRGRPRPDLRPDGRCRPALERGLRTRRLLRQHRRVRRRALLLNTEGLRYADECARHKVLDVIGDLALAGLPLLGAYRSVRGGTSSTTLS